MKNDQYQIDLVLEIHSSERNSNTEVAASSLPPETHKNMQKMNEKPDCRGPLMIPALMDKSFDWKPFFYFSASLLIVVTPDAQNSIYYQHNLT